ncbi:MAG: VOC family protein [Corynebacterium sp.]|nr:VOC family protein [Corynebacterium sp.]
MDLGVSGKYTECGVPHGFSSITPFLAIENAGEALRWYSTVFAANIVSQFEANNVTVHGELAFPSGRLQIGEPSEEHQTIPHPAGGRNCYSLVLYCSNVDEVLARAENMGAVVREPVMNFASGDRFASIRDPFGVRWALCTRIEDLSEEESARRVNAWLQQAQHHEESP